MHESTVGRRAQQRRRFSTRPGTEGSVGTGSVGHLRIFPGVMLHLWILLSLCVPCSLAQGGHEVRMTVKVLSLMFNSAGATVDIINSLNVGFNASLAAQNWTVVAGIDVTVIRPPSYNVSAAEYLENYVKNADDGESLLVVFGPMGEGNIRKSYKVLKEHNLVAFAPLTELTESRKFLPNLYFLRPEPSAELVALIRYAVNHMRVLRLGFMYTESLAGAPSAHSRATELMSQLGYELCCLFTVPNDVEETASGEAFEAEWEKFAQNLPQAAIMFTRINDYTKQIVGRLVSDQRTATTVLLAPSLLQKSLVAVWRQALEASNVSFVPHRLIQTGTNPLAKTTYFGAIRRFQNEARDYLTRHPEWSGLSDSNHFLTNDVDGELMVYGWIAGEVLMRALRSNTKLGDRISFINSLYDQRRYVIDDLVIGDFGGECATGAAAQGAVCDCNRGGKKVFMKEVVKGYHFQHVLPGIFSTSRDHCYSNAIQLHPPLSGVIMRMADNLTMLRAALEFYHGISSTASLLNVGELNRLIMLQVGSTTEQSMNDLVELRKNSIITAVFGVVVEEMLTVKNLTFIDPIVMDPRLNKFRSNVIHLSPTLEQQLYVLVSYLSKNRQGPVHLAVYSREGAEIAEVLTRTLVTFRANLSSSKIFRDVGELEKYLPAKGDVFLLGIGSGNIPTVKEYLRTHQDVRIFVQFSEVMLMYDEFVGVFNGSAGADRVLFATNLPHWGDTDSKSKTVRKFHKVVKPPHRTPLALLGFATERLMQRNIRRMEKVTSQLLVDLFFEEASITVDDMRYGTYDRESCLISGFAAAANCISNFGATNISVWSMARVMNSSVPVLQDPVTPQMFYVDPNANDLTAAQLAGAIAGSVLLFFVLLFIAVPLYFATRSGRDNDNAPKELTAPVTIVFTDIEGSTAQWAAHPEQMPDAVATHHRLIRSLIVQYRCYEVKTIGDSFMIACRSPLAAVQLACNLQRSFLLHNWRTTLFDQSYRQFEEQRAEVENDYVPPTAHLADEAYSQMWNGLRVRVGIHTGLCDIRHDEVTKGYDYYGRTTNMAARTESVTNGGQVLLTRATYLAMSGMEREQFDVTALGALPLRGVPEPVEMYQLNTVAGRQFAALRLDRDVDVLNDGTDGSVLSTSDHSSSRAELSESSQVIVTSLNALLGTFARAQRQKALLPFCERWRVVLPRKPPAIWDDSYYQEVIRRIAVKVGHVVDYCASSGADHTFSTLTSASLIVITQPRGSSS
ncbi:Adenylate and Guanylate cyclase catalytic domain containing protein [Trypanosoma brucei equiperdum]|uniref:adenylate cyclase n=1 Tax=Trypanosoma brucei equiperdum TaxID=630700 RepID=A0A3L6KXH8_9TRYP|nr:Adenylate and Guanylate cyclase catalytic domain containing protein [Trypanosoma brucei equiperdum]